MSHLIGVFGGSDDDEPSSKKKSVKKEKGQQKDPKTNENAKSNASTNFTPSKGESDENRGGSQKGKKGKNQEKNGSQKSESTEIRSGLSSGLVSVFADDEDDEAPKKSQKKKGGKTVDEEYKNDHSQTSQGPHSNLISVFADDEEEKQNVPKKKYNHMPKGIYEGAFPSKSSQKVSQRKERREKRKDHYQHYLAQIVKEGDHVDEDGDRKDFDLKSKKPTLIKTLNANGQAENETTLEIFLKQEYDNYELKPQNEIEHLIQEDDYGNVEYKLKLIHSNHERIEQLTTQMKFRLQEGNGEAKYVIGVEDDGTAKGLSHPEMYVSLKTLCGMASTLKADVIILQMRHGYEGKLAEILVRSNQKDGIKLDIKIMLLGDKQSGKSTLIGVLTSGQFDNGSGSARMHVHVHKHEVLTGETSSLSHHIMGFDSQGSVTNHTEYGHLSWEQIVDLSTKVLTFLDIGGHEKYTTKVMSSLCSFYPDYALIIISAVQKVTPVTEQHLRLACIFEMPIIIVITHVDLISGSEIYNLKSEIERTVREFSEDKYLVVANNEEDNVLFSRTLKEKLVIPVFMISNVDGTNLDLFKSFLNLLPVNNPLSTNINLHSEFYVHAIFHKKDQIILGGTVINGCISKNQVLFLGPDEKGKYRHVEVANIQCKKVSVKSAFCGQSCTIEVKHGKFADQWADSNKETIRKGMVLVDSKSQPKAAFEFTAEVSLLKEKIGKTIIWDGYEPVVTSQTTHQACTIDFEGIEPQEISEEDFNILKQETNPESVRKSSLNREIASSLSIEKKERSKSEDLRDENIGLGKITKPLSIFKHESRKSEVQSENERQDDESNDEETKNEGNGLRLTHESASDTTFSKEGEISSKLTFQEKIKQIKKSVFKEVEELVSKKRKRKFISITSDEKKLLKFRFKYHPEYMIKGQKIIMNDSTMKAIGIIKEVVYI